MKIFTYLSIFCLFIGIQTTALANHLSSKLLFAARINGDQEVPAVETDAAGVASFFLNEAKDSLCVNITVNGLSGEITGAHIHQAAMGMNGGVIFDFGPFINGNSIQTVITGEALTGELLALMLDGMTYVNIHTAMNPSGEIRGQIMLEKDRAFRAMLDPDQEVGAVESDGMGLATFNLSQSGKMVDVYAVVDNLTSDITGAHLHMAAAGEDGPVVVDLSTFLDGNVIMGSFDPSLTEGLLDAMMMGEIYINVHTTNFPAGEVRGQLMLENRLSHDAWLDTAQEVPAPTGSEGMGLAFVSLNHTMDTLFYEAQLTDLSGPVTVAHFHQAELGVAGGVLIDVSDDVIGNRISGFVTGAALSVENINLFLSGLVYLNVHTDLNPPGEVRGQVYKLAREGYTYRLEGGQEVPAVTTDAMGTGMVSIDRNQSSVHFMMVFNDLSGTASMAHFHEGMMGENGGVIFDLGPFMETDMGAGSIYGFWTAMDDATFEANDAMLFRNDMVYVNIHTAENPGGEIRGQVLRSSLCSDFTSSVFTPARATSLSLYPNPALSWARLDVGAVEQGVYTLSLFDLTGKLLIQEIVQVNGSSIELPVQKLGSGIYLLGLSNDLHSFSSKLVKH